MNQKTAGLSLNAHRVVYPHSVLLPQVQLVGWMESIAVGFFGGKARDLVPYVVVLAILMVRPYGLLGTRDIERL